MAEKKKLTLAGIWVIGCFLTGGYCGLFVTRLLTYALAPIVYYGLDKVLKESITATFVSLGRPSVASLK